MIGCTVFHGDGIGGFFLHDGTDAGDGLIFFFYVGKGIFIDLLRFGILAGGGHIHHFPLLKDFSFFQSGKYRNLFPFIRHFLIGDAPRDGNGAGRFDKNGFDGHRFIDHDKGGDRIAFICKVQVFSIASFSFSDFPLKKHHVFRRFCRDGDDGAGNGTLPGSISPHHGDGQTFILKFRYNYHVPLGHDKGGAHGFGIGKFHFGGTFIFPCNEFLPNKGRSDDCNDFPCIASQRIGFTALDGYVIYVKLCPVRSIGNGINIHIIGRHAKSGSGAFGG